MTRDRQLLGTFLGRPVYLDDLDWKAIAEGIARIPGGPERLAEMSRRLDEVARQPKE